MELKEGHNKRLLGERAAARYIGMSTGFLRQSRMASTKRDAPPAPPWIQIRRSVRYDIRDLDAWINEHRCTVKGGDHE